MLACWSCEASLPDDAAYCPRCGRNQNQRDSTPIFVVDAATELFNNVFLQAIVAQEVNRAVRYRRPLSVLVVEVDHGQTLVSDLEAERLGGLLKELGSVLVSAVRDTDTVGFLECEHAPCFGAVLPETDSAGAILAADKVRQEVALHEFVSGGKWRRLTVSCGTATAAMERSGEQELLDDARGALAAGRDRGSDANRTFQPAHV